MLPTWAMLLALAIGAGVAGLVVLVVLIRPRGQRPRGFPVQLGERREPATRDRTNASKG